MAKRFAGFTPEQMGKIIPEMKGMQADEQAKFLASQPGAAARVGKMAELAQKRIGMANGGYAKRQGYANGGGASGAELTDAIIAAGIDRKAWYTMSDAAKRDAMNNNSRLKSVFSSHDSSKGFDFVGGAGAIQGTTPNTIDTPVKMPGDFSSPGGPALPRPELPVEPEYDPSKGLPTAPEKIDTGEILQGLSWAEHSQKGIDMLLESGKLPSDEMFTKAINPDGTDYGLIPDPSKYTVSGGSNNWIFTFEDGTSTVVNRRRLIDAEITLADEITPVIFKLKESGFGERTNTSQETYDKQLDLYKQEQYTQAGEALTDVGASLDAAQKNLSQEQGTLTALKQQQSDLPANDPQRGVLQNLITEQQVKVTVAKANLSQANANVARVGTDSTTELQAAALSDPMSMTTKADVATTSDAQKEDGMIDEGTGQAAAEADEATQTEADIAANVPLAIEFEAAGMTPKEAAAEVANVMSKLTAVTGKPSEEALTQAATMSTDELAQLGLTAAQISRAQRVEGVAPLEVTPDMKVSSAVDFARAKTETNFTAATGVPSTEATVQGQLTGLLQQFEGGETPAWAAGAMRAATATLASRGLGASSMAGQAIVQAAMESALPIAQMDAQTRASFEAQNLSNKQQAAMFAAEQRSKFLGLEFDQAFQSRVQNAARIADVAKINFTAEQQVALENARMAQTVDIANLDARNAKVMADAAAMSQLDMANLNNRQQANVQRAQAFLDFDMTSMSNQQQVAMFKAQSLASVYTSDTAAANAAKQFNASSSDQVDMFFSNLQNNINQFNNDQYNSMERFNAGEANALSQFNSAQQNSRDTFNAQNQLVVAQANAQWSQAITTTDNAALNQANRDAAQAANNFTMTGYNNAIQRERDTLAWAWQSAENDKDRDAKIAVANISADAEDDGSGSALSAAAGTFMGAIASNAADIIFT
tara:strand:- start:1039 stop:3849 length:2811 start_codon:yes stop_codon:yes gene_type:complete